jgi:rubrerythrin
MGLFGSIDEVLEFAIDREIEANQLYTDLAQRTENTAMHKVFEDFAKEELGHKAKLEAMKVNRTTVPAGKVTDLKIADYVVDVEPKLDMNYQDALILAMKKEKASFHLYTDLADVVENQTQKEAFLSLAQEEARHKLRFEIEYDATVLQED